MGLIYAGVVEYANTPSSTGYAYKLTLYALGAEEQEITNVGGRPGRVSGWFPTKESAQKAATLRLNKELNWVLWVDAQGEVIGWIGEEKA